MSTGYILVRLFKVENLLPKTKANLKIINAKSRNIVYEKYNAFDISGKSTIIPLETVDKSLSQSPNSQFIIPYEIYDLEVSVEGVNPIIVRGISVFDGITSIQNIEIKDYNNTINLENLSENAMVNEQQEYTSINKNLLMTPFVLKDVFVPEFIVVHLGTPNSSSENIKVRFIDYIKNVASSEIYPTWPEEAIKANVYCQISFALNRVYTEWYRSRGYSFHITNSNDYDQCFIRGRNIFDNISKIVDDIFNEYIRTIGNITPFFSQYCNGTSVRCTGLSQWGAVDLAKRGMKALDIIKYYFGNDKELVRATIVEGIPESYPGKALRINDSNNNVKVIQKYLNRISENFPAIPRIYPENGVFGRATEQSVKVFQKVFNLVTDGIVGRVTWYNLSSIYGGIKRLGELDQGLDIDLQTGGIRELNDSSEPNWDGKYPGYRMKEGSRGNKVIEFQYYLKTIMDQYNIPTDLIVDGVFGNVTRDTVIKFQELYGLEADGIVGPYTWNKIVNVYKNLKMSTFS